MYTENEVLKAVDELSVFIGLKALELNALGYGHFIAENAPNTFKELKERSTGGVIPISGDNSENCLFPAYVNYLLRFWHDYLHLKHNLDFTFTDEIKVGELHIQEGKEAGLSYLAIEILRADTIGQSNYHKRHGEFPVYQDAFVYSCLQHGINKAIIAKH